MIFCLGLFAAVTAHAQEGLLEWKPRIYAGAGGGKLTLDNKRFFEFKENSTGWNLFAGLEINKYISVEVGHFDGGSPNLESQFGGILFDDTITRLEPDSEGDTITNRGWIGSVIGSWPFNESASVYARGGLMNWRTTAKQSADDTMYFVSNNKGSDPFVGLGFAVNIDTGMIRLEYALGSVDAIAIGPAGTQVKYSFDTTYISLAVAWKFEL